MPPKSARLSGPPGRASNRSGMMQNVYDGLTSPDNRTVVIALGFFAVSPPITNRFGTGGYVLITLQAGVTFLHSSWSELLLPP